MKVLLICNYKKGVGGISGQVELLLSYLQKEGHETEIFSTKGSVLWRLGLMCRLRKELQNYDVLHIHCCSGWGFLPAVVGVNVGRKLKKRVVLTYHGGGGEKFFIKHPRLVRHYLTRTDHNIVLSGFLGNLFDRFDIPHTIIPNIIELDEKQYRERTSLNPKFICVRSHEELYNIPCILRAFQKVQQAIPTATLTLVGGGSQHEALMKLAEEMKLKNVIFTGRVDNSEIYSYLDQSDVMLSMPIVDNMPVSLLEAMNAGLLVISSNVGGVPYMIEDGHTGVLVQSDDHDALADRMVWAMEHQTEALTIIQQAHRAVIQYQWDSIRDKIFSAYDIHS